jgi:hypothetical protein
MKFLGHARLMMAVRSWILMENMHVGDIKAPSYSERP